MNKLIIFVSFFLLSSINLFAQTDCLDKIAQQAVEISKLKEGVKQTKDMLAVKQHELQALRNDSALNSVKLKDCDSSLIRLKVVISDLAVCKQSITELGKDTVGLSLLRMQKAKSDSAEKELSRIRTNFSALEKMTKNLENDNSELVSEKGRVNKILSDKYQSSFDLLVKTSTLESVESDIVMMEILKVENKLAEKINKLKIYKQYELLMGEKFNESKIEEARRSLSVISKEKIVSDLVNLLTNYKEKNDAIKQMINDLQNKNAEKSKVAALIVEKKEKTMYLIENYISLYSIDMKHYSYLNKIVGDLKARKLQNVDADVLDLLERL